MMHTVHSSPSRAASPTSWCELLLMLLLLHGVRSLLVGPPTFNSVHLFPGGSVGGPAVSTGRCPSGGAVVRMMGVPKLQQKSAAKPSLSSFDGVTREAFLAGTAAVIVAGLAPGGLTPPAGPRYDVMNERIFDTRKMSYLPADPVGLIVNNPRMSFDQGMVCLGETHTHPMHHRMQFNVIKATHQVAMAARQPLAIGLEMFYRQQQAPLDRYVYKHGDLRLLKDETQWDKTWGFDFNQYAKVFRYAREQGIRLVGLNAPSSLLYLVNKVGLDALPKQVQSILPEMDLGQEAHRQRFEKSIHSFPHGAGLDAAAMNRMYQAQTLWDEYMAETASGYLKRAGGSMVLLAGNGHVQARDGIPDRVERRIGIKPFTVVPVDVEWTKEGLPDIDHPPGTSFADWVYYTQREIGPPARGAGSVQRQTSPSRAAAAAATTTAASEIKVAGSATG